MPPGHPQAIPVPQSTPLVGIKQVQIQQLVQANQTLAQIAANTTKIGIAGPKAFNTWSASVKSFGKELGTVSSNLAKMKDSIGSIAKVSLGSFAAAGAAITGLAAAASSDVFDTFTGSFGLLAAQVGRMFTPALIEASYAIQGIAKYVKEMDPEVRDQITGWAKMGLLIAGAAAIGIAVLPALSAAVSVTANVFGIAASGAKLVLASLTLLVAHPAVAFVLLLAAAVGFLAYQFYELKKAIDSAEDSMTGKITEEQYEQDTGIQAIKKIANPEERKKAFLDEADRRIKERDAARKEYGSISGAGAAVGALSPLGGIAFDALKGRKDIARLTEAEKAVERMRMFQAEQQGRPVKFGSGQPEASGFEEFAGRMFGAAKGFVGDVKGEGFGPAIQKLIGNIMPKNMAKEFEKLQKDVAGGPDRRLKTNVNANPMLMGVEEAWRQAQQAVSMATSKNIDAERLAIAIDERNKQNEWRPKVLDLLGQLGLRPIGPQPGPRNMGAGGDF